MGCMARVLATATPCCAGARARCARALRRHGEVCASWKPNSSVGRGHLISLNQLSVRASVSFTRVFSSRSSRSSRLSNRRWACPRRPLARFTWAESARRQQKGRQFRLPYGSAAARCRAALPQLTPMPMPMRPLLIAVPADQWHWASTQRATATICVIQLGCRLVCIPSGRCWPPAIRPRPDCGARAPQRKSSQWESSGRGPARGATRQVARAAG